VLKGEDYDAIKDKTEELKKALEEIGASIYKGAGPEAGAGGEGGPRSEGPTDGSATDADFKVEK